MAFLNVVYGALILTAVVQQPVAQWSKKSIFSTVRQVEFPGIVLEAGEYIVRLGDNDDRHGSVQILNKDETQVLATLVAVPDHRLRPDDSREFTFHEVKSDGPQPVQSWFYSGDLVGLEFVYPKVRAKEIARESNERVIAAGLMDPVILAVTPNGKELVLDKPAPQVTRHKGQ